MAAIWMDSSMACADIWEGLMGTGSVGLVIPEQFDEVPTRGELLNSEAGPSSKQAGKQARRMSN